MNENFRQNGINNDTERAENDLYCTPPQVVKLLLEYEKFSPYVWECCNGLSHISKVLEDNGYSVRKSDIIDYNGENEIIDFLQYDGSWDGDIVTNPPYKGCEKFVEKAMDVVNNGAKVAMYVKLNFLSTQRRKALFNKYPPKTIYSVCKRYSCGKNGKFPTVNGTVDYVWIVWEKGYKGETIIKWI